MKGPKPFYRKQTKAWYVQIGKKQHNLGKNKKEAWAKYHALMADRQDIEDDTTVAQLIDRYLEWCKNHRAKRTYDWYAWHLNSLLDSVGCRLKVRDIKPYHATRWLDERYKGTSDTYRCGAVRTLKRAFNWAVKEGYLARSPVANVSRPVQRSRIAYLTPVQWQELAKEVKEREDPDFLDIITVMKLTGCRPQEARWVEARHFNRETECWVFPVEESKGKRERRIVYLTDADGTALEITRRRALKYPKGPLFRNSRGNGWTSDALNCSCRRYRKRMGFQIFPYIFRHTFATDAIVRGVDLMTIATLMGHKDLTMLTRIYQHLNLKCDHLKDAMRQITDAEDSDAA